MNKESKANNKNETQDVKKFVRRRYAGIARQGSSCCGSGASASCCGSTASAGSVSKQIGYSDRDLSAVPEGANLGLGCGNPIALASLKEGETVLDLGSGAGFDCFLAATRVGKTGKVIGVDMTPEMLEKARENQQKGDYGNVEFRLGEIENLPVADNSVDVVISNCVINLSPDKGRVFRETYRVLKAGGRIMVSDIVLLKPLPDAIRNSIEAYVGCIAGAALKDEYIKAIKSAGFSDIKVLDEVSFAIESVLKSPAATAIIKSSCATPETVSDTSSSVVSARIAAVKSG